MKDLKNRNIFHILILTIFVIFVSLFIGNNKVYAKYCNDIELDVFCRESWNTVKDLDFVSDATLYDYHGISRHDMCGGNHSDGKGGVEMQANSCCWHSASAGTGHSYFLLKGIIDFDGFGNFTVTTAKGTYQGSKAGAAGLAYFGAHVQPTISNRTMTRGCCWMLLEKGVLSAINDGNFGLPKFGKSGNWNSAGYAHDSNTSWGLYKDSIKYESEVNAGKAKEYYRSRAFIFLSQDGVTNMQDRIIWFGGKADEPDFAINKYVQVITDLNSNESYRFENNGDKKEDRVAMIETDKQAEPAETEATHIKVRYRISVSNTGPVPIEGVLTDLPDSTLFGNNPVVVIKRVFPKGNEPASDEPTNMTLGSNESNGYTLRLKPGEVIKIYIEIEGKDGVLTGKHPNTATFTLKKYFDGKNWKDKDKVRSSSDYVLVSASIKDPKIDKYIIAYDTKSGGKYLTEEVDGKETAIRANKKNTWKKENPVEVGVNSVDHVIAYKVKLTNPGSVKITGHFKDEPDEGLEIKSVKINGTEKDLEFDLDLEGHSEIYIDIVASLKKGSVKGKYKNIATYTGKSTVTPFDEYDISSRDFFLIEEVSPRINKYIYKIRGEDQGREDMTNNDDKKKNPVFAEER